MKNKLYAAAMTVLVLLCLVFAIWFSAKYPAVILSIVGLIVIYHIIRAIYLFFLDED